MAKFKNLQDFRVALANYATGHDQYLYGDEIVEGLSLIEEQTSKLKEAIQHIETLTSSLHPLFSEIVEAQQFLNRIEGITS